MKIRLDQIPEHGQEVVYEEPVETFGFLNETEGEDVKVLAPVTVFLRIDRTANGAIIRGSLKGVVETTCSRCLSRMKESISQDFTYDCVPYSGETGKVEEFGEEEADIYYFKGVEIDTAPFISEQVVLALPMGPICGPGCKGLCPRCGKDLNAGDCGCSKGGEGVFSSLEGLER